MRATFALFCFLTLISRGWAMDDEQMSQLLVGTWESVDDSQQAITGPAHMVFDFTYYANGRFKGTTAMTFPPGQGQATSGIIYTAGTWKIQDGNLIAHTEQVDPSEFAPLYPVVPLRFNSLIAILGSMWERQMLPTGCDDATESRYLR